MYWTRYCFVSTQLNLKAAHSFSMWFSDAYYHSTIVQRICWELGGIGLIGLVPEFRHNRNPKNIYLIYIYSSIYPCIHLFICLFHVDFKRHFYESFGLHWSLCVDVCPQTSKNCDMERSNWANLGDSDFMFQGFIEVFMNSHSISIRCGLDWLDMTLDRDIHWISIRYH